MFHSRQHETKATEELGKDLGQYTDAIRRLEPINRLPPAAVDSLLEKMTLEAFSPGDSVTKSLKDTKNVAYLVHGAVRLVSEHDHSESLEAGSANALKAIDRRSSSFTDIFAIDACVFIKIPWDHLETLMLEHVPGEITGNFEVNEILAATASNWMVKLLQSELFSQLPATNIQEVLSLGTSITTVANETIVQQGDPGTEFFIIESGECVVTRKTSKSDREITLATLGAADYFGEEALITGAPRGATVRVSKPGNLLKLKEEYFNRCLMEPTIKRVTVDEAISINNDGCQWIDTRDPTNYQSGAIPDSKNIAVNMIRLTANQLETDETYIVCDADPKIAAAAAFLLSIRGFDARCLDATIEAYCGKIGIELKPIVQDNPVRPKQPQKANRSAPASEESAKEDSEDPGTMALIDKLSDEHTEHSGDEPAIVPDFSETVTGIGLAQLMGDLKKNFKATDPDVATSASADPIDTLPAQQLTSIERAVNTQALDEAINLETQSAVSDMLAGKLNELSKDLEIGIAAHTEKLLNQQRCELQKEFEMQIEHVKQQAKDSMKAHEHKVARAYKKKFTGLQENGRKLIALANKISKQKSELLAAKKLLEENMAEQD